MPEFPASLLLNLTYLVIAGQGTIICCCCISIYAFVIISAIRLNRRYSISGIHRMILCKGANVVMPIIHNIGDIIGAVRNKFPSDNTTGSRTSIPAFNIITNNTRHGDIASRIMYVRFDYDFFGLNKLRLRENGGRQGRGE